MKVIIAGSRNITDYNSVKLAIIKSGFVIDEIVSGGAKGVDALGEKFAYENCISLKIFPANWDKYGKSAGYIRNQQMAKYADALIAIWDGKSMGTKHMIELAKKRNIRIYLECPNSN